MAVCDVILQSDFQKRQTIYDGPKIAQMQHYNICDLFYICNAMHFWIKGYNMRKKKTNLIQKSVVTFLKKLVFLCSMHSIYQKWQ